MKTKPFATVVVGAFEVNCYLVPSPDKKTLYIIDPGGDAQDIIAAASAFSCQKAVILLTHCHADHIGAVGEVAKKLNITELYIDPADSAMYASPANCFPPYLPAAENLLTPSEWPPQTPDFEILHTPGHTPHLSRNSSNCHKPICSMQLFLKKKNPHSRTNLHLFQGSKRNTCNNPLYLQVQILEYGFYFSFFLLCDL